VNNYSTSRARASQVRYVATQQIAIYSQVRALYYQLNKSSRQLSDRHTQLRKLDTLINIQNTDVDALRDQWSDRHAQLQALTAAISFSTFYVDLLSIRFYYPKKLRNTDFSEMGNVIATCKTALTALQNKVTAFKKDINKPLGAHSGDPLSVLNVPVRNFNE
jgi:uncharacterized protein YhaN